MRSDRDIQRTPKRPLTRTATGSPAAPKAAPAPAEDGKPAAPKPTVTYAPRQDARGDGRPEPRGDYRNEPRRDARPEARGERRPDARGEPRQGPRNDDRPAPRWEDRQAPRGDARPVPSFDRPRERAPAADPGLARNDQRRNVSSARPDGPARPQPRDAGPAYPRQDPANRGPRAVKAAPSKAKVYPGATPPRDPAEGVRLSKVLSDRGLASRREADDWIDAGWVKVDGEMAVLGQRVKPNARIEIDPAAHTQQAKRITVLINKPIGYVSGQAEDGYEPAVVLVTAANHWEEDPTQKPFHAGHARGLAPAGRLDIDSTGLLVLTQDGRVAKHLIGEHSLVEKEYLVRVEPMGEGPFPPENLEKLNHGLWLDDVELKPAKVSWANEDQLRFVLREGRKRQIRRMCELVGLKVTGLKRVRIGSVVLGKLPAGQWRYLREDERF
ncbi:MAG TPA: pseudouridine synthase [Ideonella sp.]|uniref:pseudouridine synthase n=1 Tax=Ideonella sp. TaxID=1929293 RepID=UPI002B76C6D2|nr:pseudouridine synthase [Ideonella sp.]HSI47976.1 pseudouridine synthase [Ideonella sp.]